MTCNESLELMLEAELEELRGVGSSPVAAHLRTCARCRAVAARLVDDTRALATALDARSVTVRSAPARRTARLRPLVIAGALAATALLAVAVRAPRVAPPVPQTTAETVTSARQVAPAIASRVKPPAVPPAHRDAVPVASRRFADAAPVEVPPYVSSAPSGPSLAARTEAEPLTISVDPPAGTRAAVIRTNNPAITVVWLY